jgi:hypothetical protein
MRTSASGTITIARHGSQMRELQFNLKLIFYSLISGSWISLSYSKGVVRFREINRYTNAGA